MVIDSRNERLLLKKLQKKKEKANTSKKKKANKDGQKGVNAASELSLLLNRIEILMLK